MIRARFDDLTQSAGSFELSDPVAVFTAREPAQVRASLRAAEGAARGGRWVAGFVTYEAAAGLDCGLDVVPNWPAGDPMASLPLVFFAAFRTRTFVTPPTRGARIRPAWRLDRGRAWHTRAVATIQDEIAAGSYYQLNLTARLKGTAGSIDELYASVCASQRSEYNALIRTGEFTIASFSPELFFGRSGRDVVTRPMKGTATRGRWPAEDAEHAAALRFSDKERAENAMIVDLLRNDLGRIAETGTVSVARLFTAERYPTLWQLTSEVRARARPDVDLVALFEALFPSGSVTGAPKRAAMAAIARVEGRRRGVYCGAIGYLAPGGSRPAARFSVAIRTVLRADPSGRAVYGTGGGITHLSEPAAEWAELLAKTAAVHEHAEPVTLFETLLFDPPAGPRDLDRHLRRLADSAAYFGFPFSLAGAATDVKAAVASRRDPARIRVVLHRDGAVRVEVTELDATPDPVLLEVAERPVRSDDALLFHKHGDRSGYLAHRATRPGADDVVLFNERGEATETTTANLAVRRRGRWYTPALGCGLLPGVERGRLLESGTLSERVIALDDLRGAEEIAVLNSLRGWRRAELRSMITAGRPPGR